MASTATLAPYIPLKTALLTIAAALVPHQIRFGTEFVQSTILITTRENLYQISALRIAALIALVLFVLVLMDLVATRCLSSMSPHGNEHQVWPATLSDDKPLQAIHQMIAGGCLIGLAAMIDAQTEHSFSIEARIVAYATGALLLVLATRRGGWLTGLAIPRPVHLFLLRITALLTEYLFLRIWLYVPDDAAFEVSNYAVLVYWVLSFTPFAAALLAILFLYERPSIATCMLVLIHTIVEAGLVHLLYWEAHYVVPRINQTIAD